MTDNNIIEVTIEKVIYGGKGLARHNGKVVFIPGTLPSEKIQCRIVNTYKSYSEAVLIKNLLPSMSRRTPPCPYYEECGGCHLMHARYEEQLNIKNSMASEFFDSFRCNRDTIVPSRSEFNYRNKITLHLHNGTCGYMKEKSNNIIEIDRCMLADNRLNEVLVGIKNKLPDTGRGKLILRHGNADEVQLYSDLSFSLDTYQKNTLCSIYHGDSVTGNKYIKKDISGIPMYLSPEVFFQVNYSMLEKINKIFLEHACGNTLVDAYCGTGIFSFLLKDRFNRIIGIDINSNNINYSFFVCLK
ncbi:MAG: class I SAM-dependent RNA methyltransferase [Candidatus Muiribacteriaceae bacterium]